jgi:hypothetical protein
MDLSKYKAQAESSILEELEPGTYDFEYVSDEEIQGKNGWVALKVLFRVVDKPNFMIGHAFTTDHANSAGAINIGLSSLHAMSIAGGFPDGFPDDSADLVGIRVRAHAIKDAKGYIAIDDMKGKGWFPPKSTKEVKADEPVSNSEAEDNIPF